MLVTLQSVHPAVLIKLDRHFQNQQLILSLHFRKPSNIETPK